MERHVVDHRSTDMIMDFNSYQERVDTEMLLSGLIVYAYCATCGKMVYERNNYTVSNKYLVNLAASIHAGLNSGHFVLTRNS